MAAEEMAVTVTGAGDKSGTDGSGNANWANAMDLAAWLTDMDTNVEPGDVYYVEEGTYTLAGAVDASARDGTTTSVITVIGVKSGTSAEPPVLADWADDTARPLIAAAANQTKWGDYWFFHNIRMTTTSSLGWEMGLSTILDNCASNNSGASNRRAFYATNNLCRFIGCDGACINGFAFDNAAANTVCVACYGHDSVIGFRAASGVMFVFNNVFDTCSGSGVDVSNRSGCLLIGNTIYNCGTGITGTSHTWGLFLNNILDANTIGVEMTTPVDSNYFDYNCWNNTDDIQDSDINQGVHAVTGDPGMNNPTDGDFGVTEADANVHDKAIDAGDKTGAIV